MKPLLFYSGLLLAGIVAGDQAANLAQGGALGANGPINRAVFSNATLIDYQLNDVWIFAIGVLLMVFGVLLRG